MIAIQLGERLRLKASWFILMPHRVLMASDWFSRWNKSYKSGEINRQVCVHTFLDDKEIWQYLHWNHRGWHAGGKANDTYIGFEICEPGGFSYSKNQMVGYDVKK